MTTHTEGSAAKAGAAQVKAWAGVVVLPTYLPAKPDVHPMFFEKRVYQGSNGKVYPLPFTDRIAESAAPREWQALWIENAYLKVMVLPELGGRIHAILDKTNGYDLVYNQPVIKPALVGLAGPWISGGIEFNWPQHHRPATFLPVDWVIEEHEDGSKTIWCSDHDPMCRMKGMHGVCLHPDRAQVEVKARVYNRTAFVQTFLWWANVATRVHEGYQSFFPPDVYWVADHARRSTSDYPLATGSYYGIDYGQRGKTGIPENDRPRQFVPPHCREDREPTIPDYPPNHLAFYANIPTPCSYMCMGTKGGFFGGYDYQAGAGIVHVADPVISPGKKQWTWGNHEFGYAWDRNLTDPDAEGVCWPYIEIMAGVYSDNQPDFSFLQPGETKTWSQYWYPVREIGPAQEANLNAALSVRVKKEQVHVGLAVTRAFEKARITVLTDGREHSRMRNLSPAKPLLLQIPCPAQCREEQISVCVKDRKGDVLIAFRPAPRIQAPVPAPAQEPPSPESVKSGDELYIIGLHLDQYRHATRCPTLYWREALRRDPLDARCNNAIGLWHLRRGELRQAESHFRIAIGRLTSRNANPYDGEAYYNLGLCLRYQMDGAEPQSEAYHALGKAACEAFGKSTWNLAWRAAGAHALAELDCLGQDWPEALAHVEAALRVNGENTRARNLKALILRKLGRSADANALARETLAMDPLDWWARAIIGDRSGCDLQTQLDVAHDYARAGFLPEAIAVLDPGTLPARDLPDRNWGAVPLVHYTLGWLWERIGELDKAAQCRARGASATPDYCFPARLEEMAILQSALTANSQDGRAGYLLGNLLYDRRRHREAMALWERSARLQPGFSVVWRNLGIGYYNILRNAAKARAAYDRAFRLAPTGRVLFERDQLRKRTGASPEVRLRQLAKYPDLVRERDDLCVELCALWNQLGRYAEALELLGARRFQPWEGGEGGALGQYVRACLGLGREALRHGDPTGALQYFERALEPPLNLGEARHILANQGDIRFHLGEALAALGRVNEAREQWLAAATFQGDFQQMSVRPFSEMSYYSGLGWERLKRPRRARKLFTLLLDYARNLENAPAVIDFFATSLPTMLLFEDDLGARQKTTACLLQAQAYLGLGQTARAQARLRLVLRREPSHPLAADLMAEMARGARGK